MKMLIDKKQLADELNEFVSTVSGMCDDWADRVMDRFQPPQGHGLTKAQREKLVIKLREVHGNTFREIGKHFGITDVRAGQIYRSSKSCRTSSQK